MRQVFQTSSTPICSTARRFPHKENVKIAKGLLERCAKSQLVLEVEAGVVGGEEDGVTGEAGAKLYTTPEDMLLVENELSGIGRYTLAATFGNVHGVYKPGNVKTQTEGS